MNSLGNNIPRTNLVGEWLLDGNANATVGTNGTATNVTWGTDGVRGYQKGYGIFNGTSSYVQVADYNGIDLTTSYTLSAWIYITALPTSGNLYAIIDKNIGNRNGYEFELWNNGGTQTIFVSHLSASTATTYSISYTLPTNSWILLSVTFSGSTINFWLNGEIIGTVTSVSTIPTAGTSVLEIGRNPAITSRHFSGRMDLVRIYNTALTQAEIQLLYFEGLKKLGPSNIASYPALFNGLVGYWDMKGTAHNIVNGVASTVTGATLTTDRFGNANSAYSFNGTNQYMSTTIPTINTDFTLNFWYYRSGNGTGANPLICGCGEAFNSGFIINEIASSKKFACYYSTVNIFYEPGVVLKDNTWEMVTYTKSGTNFALYRDGVSVATTTNATAFTSSTTFQIAKRLSSAEYFNGNIGSPMVFSRGLSADEVSQLYTLTSKDYIYPTKSYDLPGLRDGLILDLNEQGKDLSGNGNNGTLINSPTVIRQGKMKGLTYVSASSQYITCGDVAAADFGTGNFSISMWLKPTTLATFMRIINKYNNTPTNNGFEIRTDNTDKTKAFFWTYDGSSSELISAAGLFADGVWGHYVFGRNSTGLFIYKNGVLFGNNTTTARNINNTYSLTIGQLLASGYFSGSIINPKIWNRELTATEIQQLYYKDKGNYIY